MIRVCNAAGVFGTMGACDKYYLARCKNNVSALSSFTPIVVLVSHSPTSSYVLGVLILGTHSVRAMETVIVDDWNPAVVYTGNSWTLGGSQVEWNS